MVLMARVGGRTENACRERGDAEEKRREEGRVSGGGEEKTSLAYGAQ
jgi:hypothetical protein